MVAGGGVGTAIRLTFRSLPPAVALRTPGQPSRVKASRSDRRAAASILATPAAFSTNRRGKGSGSGEGSDNGLASDELLSGVDAGPGRDEEAGDAMEEAEEECNEAEEAAGDEGTRR